MLWWVAGEDALNCYWILNKYFHISQLVLEQPPLVIILTWAVKAITKLPKMRWILIKRENCLRISNDSSEGLSNSSNRVPLISVLWRKNRLSTFRSIRYEKIIGILSVIEYWHCEEAISTIYVLDRIDLRSRKVDVSATSTAGLKSDWCFHSNWSYISFLNFSILISWEKCRFQEIYWTKKEI